MKKFALLFICCLIIFLGINLCSNVIPTFHKKTTKCVVVIDPGHGGVDPGMVSTDNTMEKDINLAISKYLKDYLIAQDYEVYLTRENDNGLYDSTASNKKANDMRKRIEYIQKLNASYVISIHQNSYPRETLHGAQTFYYKESDAGKALAHSIQQSLLDFDSTNTRIEKENADYYILKKSPVPAVLVECGFLSNKEETSRLNDSNYQKEIAYTICMGFCKFEQKRRYQS